MFSIAGDFDKAYNSKNSITLKITGIIRGKEREINLLNIVVQDFAIKKH